MYGACKSCFLTHGKLALVTFRYNGLDYRVEAVMVNPDGSYRRAHEPEPLQDANGRPSRPFSWKDKATGERVGLEPGSSLRDYYARRHGKQVSARSYMLKIRQRGDREVLIPAELCYRTRLSPEEKSGGITDQIRAHIEREPKSRREQQENALMGLAVAALTSNGDAERYGPLPPKRPADAQLRGPAARRGGGGARETAIAAATA